LRKRDNARERIYQDFTQRKEDQDKSPGGHTESSLKNKKNVCIENERVTPWGQWGKKGGASYPECRRGSLHSFIKDRAS